MWESGRCSHNYLLFQYQKCHFSQGILDGIVIAVVIVAFLPKTVVSQLSLFLQNNEREKERERKREREGERERESDGRLDQST